MKKILFLLFMIPFIVSCGSDDDELSATQKQEKSYNLVENNIVGHWIGAQYYNTADLNKSYPVGWRDISEIYWDLEYIFNKDGTGKVITYLENNITYSIEKNEDYINHPDTECELFCVLKGENGISTKRAIWFDSDGFLHIIYGHEKSETSIRYKRQ